MVGKDIAWTEGMFVQPHHFQQAFFNLEHQVSGLLRDFIPHFTGISHLKIAEGDCENNILKIAEIDCRFPSGTRVQFPGNAVIESRNFEKLLNQNQGRLEVFLGLPHFSAEEPNCLRFDQTGQGSRKYRYTTQLEKVNDVLAGGNPREVEIKELNPRLFFGGERLHGYETIRIAAVELSGSAKAFGSVAKLDKEHIPPCINVAGSPRLQQYLHEIGNRLVARHRGLRKFWKGKEIAPKMKTRDTLKVQTMAMAANSFAQFSTIGKLHPFQFYVKLAEIIGMLSIYCDEDRFVEVPPYDHDNLNACFETAYTNLMKLLSLLEDVTYEARVFETNDDNLLTCDLDPAWFDEKFDLYICFESQMGEEEVRSRVLGLKTAPENLIPELNKRRIRGILLRGPVFQIPSLPASGNHFYFVLPRDPAYFPRLREQPRLGIWGPHDFAEVVTFFAVEKKE